jgi:hypothetical protein
MRCFLFAFAALALCFSAYAASDVRSGVWTAELQNDQLELTIFHGRSDRPGGGHQDIMGMDTPIATFAGLKKDDVTSSGANVQFELRRAAGTFAFEGRVANGTGAGHYRFTPSDAFLRDMESLGYSDFKDEMLLVFAVNDFSPQTVRDLKGMGYEPTRHEIEDIAIFKITPDFLREMARAGYSDLSLRDALNFRVGRVDAAYVNAMRELGYANLPAHKLADMAILGVTPAYIRELRAAGLTNLSAQQLSDLRVGNVSAKRIEEYRKLGYDHLTAKQLSEMGIFGVTPDYIRRLSEKGYNNVPIGKLLQLRQMNADKIIFR